MKRPDRPAGGIKSKVRGVVRGIRITRHKAMLRGKLSTGENVIIGANAVLLPPNFLRIGDNVAIGRDFHLESNLEIGSEVLISSRVAIVGNDHSFSAPNKSVYWAGRNPPATAVLEGDNLIGFGVTIVGNVRIGHGCIVGAGAVVTSDLPPNTVCVGIPAKPIRNRFPSDKANSEKQVA